MTNGISDLVVYAKHHLSPILQREGSILYSAAITIRPGDLYILGLNPGGEPGQPGTTTIAESLDALPNKTANDYLEKWGDGRRGTYDAGCHPLQMRLRWLTEQLGFALTDACASNLIFARSRYGKDAGYQSLAKMCWPVHERIIEHVRPRLLIVFGNGPISPFRWLLHLGEAQGGVEKLCETASGHGTWRVAAFGIRVGGNPISIVGLPHLSRYNVTRNGNVVSWIRSLMR
jgi:hypothetical protein